ncbi:MAG TPA: peptide deformylase [Acidimicrobiales bacterium]|nr:peptide deformylase [Acidimicrobiales bacterium]
MAIVQAGAAILRRPARVVDERAIGSAELAGLVAALHAGLAVTPGVGLAAPQIGVGWRVVLVQDPAVFQARVSPERLAQLEREPVEPYILINPEIEPVGPERRSFFEGCLSVDGYCALVDRAWGVRVRWTDETGRRHEAVRRGWHARILQHEVDHLNGILYVDRMYSRTFMTNDNYGAWADRPLDVIRATFGVP